MSAHTPGPWLTKFDGMNAYSAEVFSRSRRGLPRVLARCARPYEGDAKANAHLIAAAPDLLEALSDVYAQLCGTTKSCGHEGTCVCPGDKARAAIAKARG